MDEVNYFLVRFAYNGSDHISIVAIPSFMYELLNFNSMLDLFTEMLKTRAGYPVIIKHIEEVTHFQASQFNQYYCEN